MARKPTSEVSVVEGDGLPSAPRRSSTRPHTGSPRTRVTPEVYTLLIVEDDLNVRESLVDLFTLTGFTVWSAANGRQALQKLRSKTPDLVIADVMMPVMDGMALLRRLRARKETALLPVILLTARTMLETRLEGLETGADDYITKPFNARELIMRVTNMIQTRKNLLLTMYSEPSRIITESRDEVFLKTLREFIEARISHPDLNIEDACLEMRLSRSTIQKRLKRITGRSFNRFLRDFRLERANDLLAANAASISDIAFLVGFNSLSYFSRSYKESFGCSPRDRQNSCTK